MQKPLARACRIIEKFISDREIDGAGLAVWKSGEHVADWYSGQAGPDLPAGENVLWPLASISKLYTVAAVMSLVEDGKLTLSMRLADVLPEFGTDTHSGIRLWHLLTHTSGLIYESPEMEKRLASRTSLRAMIDEAFTHQLLSSPGERLEYSDYGIALAGRAAEAVTGCSLSAIVHSRVLAPSGLEQTFFPPPEGEYERLATIRDVPAADTPGEMYNSTYCRQLAHPAFGVVASVGDLLRFGLAFLTDSDRRIVSPATSRLMTRDQLGGGLPGGLVGLELTRPQPWGLGFMVRGDSLQLGFGEVASPSAFGHAGASGCVLLVDPELDVALAFVSNRHANSGFERFLFRESAVTSAVLSELS